MPLQINLTWTCVLVIKRPSGFVSRDLECTCTHFPSTTQSVDCDQDYITAKCTSIKAKNFFCEDMLKARQHFCGCENACTDKTQSRNSKREEPET